MGSVSLFVGCVQTIERLFNRLKQFRRLATRSEKRAANYLAMLHLGAILIWINAFADTP